MRHRPLTTPLLIALALLAPVAFGQTASHSLTVSTPSYIGLRIVGAGSGPRSVTFDYATNPTNYLTTIDNGGGTLPPTSTDRFDDIEANVVGIGFWYVNVQATPLTYTGPGTGAGLDLNDLRVNRGSNSGLTQTAIRGWLLSFYDTAWNLSPTPQRIARSFLGTNGWRSLGFNGNDYTLDVNGNEDAGTYATTVTYYLTFP